MRSYLRRCFVATTAVVSVATVANASVTINLTAGQLYGATTSEVLPHDGLIQLLASTADATFSSPTVGSFSSGDDVVLASFGLDETTIGVDGSFSYALNLDYSGFANLGAGDALLLRWFPNLTAASTSSAVAAGTAFGQFNNLLTSVDYSNTWYAPADGLSIDLNFLNGVLGGSYPDSLALATNTVVPEQSTYAAVLGSLVLGVVGYRRFRKR